MPEQTEAAVRETRTGGRGFTPDANNGYSRTAGDLPVGDRNVSPRPPTNGVGGMTEPTQANGSLGIAPRGGSAKSSDGWAIAKAQEIYTTARTYMEANITLQWERNLYHFRNEHGPGSPYASTQWRRARTFRPKTRANTKAQEAAHAAAAFATQDYLDVQAFDPTDEHQVLSASISKALVQYRLETVPWKWLLTAQGAFQDTKVYGICVSHQYWRHEQTEEIVPAFDEEGQPITGEHPETGEKVAMGVTQMKTTADMPVVDLMSPENFLFDPMCDWRNPAQTSPTLAALFPMYAEEVIERMTKPTAKTGQPLWRPYPIAQLLATRSEQMDSRTRRAREGRKRVDPAQNQMQPEYQTLWAHLNIARVEGVDLAWWTLGTELLLTDPIPLTDMYPHLAPGERPFVTGYSVVEAHRNYPAGDVEQIAPLQEEINAVANQRLDNVRLVLNKRYFIRRGSQMDLDALMRNVPGGGVMTNDPEKDVQVVNTPDVTGSSYQEQDRLSSDLEELVGGFGQQAAQAAGKMVDRAGSLDQIQGAAGAVQDYSIKLFFDTWMEPVLRQLVKMEQMYETDRTILSIAAKKTPLWIRYGQDEVTDSLLQHDLIVRINVGIGNTDPVKRVQKLAFGVGQIMQLPNMQQRVKSSELADEIMGALGYKDASRFFMTDEEYQQYVKQNPPQPPPEIALKQRELEIRQKQNDDRHQRETSKDAADHEWRMKQLEQTSEFNHEKLEHQTGIAAGKTRTMRDIAAAREFNRLAETHLKRADSARPQPPKVSKPPPKGGSGGPPK